MMTTKQPENLDERGFNAALGFVLPQEGGYIDHPKDPGGPTYKGVSLRAVVDLRYENGALMFDLDGDGDVDRDDILMLAKLHESGDDKMISEFYLKNYWRPAACHCLRWPLSLAVFDAAVNHGPRSSVKMLQKAVGATPDGIAGAATVRAANAADPHVPALVRRILVERSYLYHRLSVARGDDFYKGWLKRLFDLQAECLRRI